MEGGTAQGGCFFFDILDGGVGGRGTPPLVYDWCGRGRAHLWVRGRDYVLVSMVPGIPSRPSSVANLPFSLFGYMAMVRAIAVVVAMFCYL